MSLSMVVAPNLSFPKIGKIGPHSPCISGEFRGGSRRGPQTWVFPMAAMVGLPQDRVEPHEPVSAIKLFHSSLGSLSGGTIAREHEGVKIGLRERKPRRFPRLTELAIANFSLQAAPRGK